MAESGSDVIMFFQDKDGIYLDAECSSQLDFASDSTFLEGFSPGKFCEITDFDIGIKKDGSDSGNTTKSTGPFGSWLATQSSDKDASRFPIHFDELNFNRLLDCASPVLFEKCCKKETFQRIVALRRRNVGSAAGPKPYLRLEFKEVLLTKVNWQGSDTVKESCGFICREFKAIYRITDDAGHVTEFQPAKWKFEIFLAKKGEQSS